MVTSRSPEDTSELYKSQFKQDFSDIERTKYGVRFYFLASFVVAFEWSTPRKHPWAYRPEKVGDMEADVVVWRDRMGWVEDLEPFEVSFDVQLI